LVEPGPQLHVTWIDGGLVDPPRADTGVGAGSGRSLGVPRAEPVSEGTVHVGNTAGVAVPVVNAAAGF
jgi:hypothetical protein